ncbi:hypothetical protein CEXT_624501 [Caerostris extrusa]|uniref:Uncharacterized protein n=1 Tax=Caerostris extrusa TaxID=172846 RepID=A0AAV4U4X3_CAEEX|nr:hypothetical protein CEXT_624501 [Caerostris extrusa]
MNAIHRHNSLPEIFLLHPEIAFLQNSILTDRRKGINSFSLLSLQQKLLHGLRVCKYPLQLGELRGPFGVSRAPGIVRFPKRLAAALAVAEIGI